MSITYEDQLVAQSFINNLVYDKKDTFSTELALALRDMLEPNKPKKFIIDGTIQSKRSSWFRNMVTNLGNVNLEDEEIKETKFGNKLKSIWIGNFELTRMDKKNGSVILIESRFLNEDNLPRYEYKLKTYANGVVGLFKITRVIYNLIFMRVSFPKETLVKTGV